MESPFQRARARIAGFDVLGSVMAPFLRHLSEPHRQTLQNLRTQLSEPRPRARFEFIRRHPVADDQHVRGAAMILGAVYEGGSVLGANVIRGEVAGRVRGANVLVGAVRGGDVRAVNLIVGDVYEGRVRGVNIILGDIRGGEVQCNILIGDVYDGRVNAEIVVGHERGGAVDAREWVHIHDCPH